MLKGNNFFAKKKKLEKGLSLIEASMVLVLSAVVVAGVMVYYQSAQDNNKMEQTLSQTLSLVGGVNGLYAGQSNYNGLDSTTIAQSGAVPSGAIDINNKVVNGFGTNTEAYGVKLTTGVAATTGNNDGYALVLKSLNKAQCTKVSSQKINGSLYGTGVVKTYDGKTALNSGKGGNYILSNDITPAAMAKLCGKQDTNDVVFVLK